jgi:hypothetical protein
MFFQLLESRFAAQTVKARLNSQQYDPPDFIRVAGISGPTR